MLYNPTWDNRIVSDRNFTNESLVAWLEKQPANETYPYNDPTNCLLAQYFDQHGFEYSYVHSCAIVCDHAKPESNTWGYYAASYNPMWNCVAKSSETYGDALRILKALM